MRKKITAILIIFSFLTFSGFISHIYSSESQSSKENKLAIKAVKEMLGEMDRENVVKIAKEEKKGKMGEWFKAGCKTNKILGEILKYCEKIDEGRFIFQEVIPDHIPNDVWVRYFGNGKIRFGKVKDLVKVTSNRKNGLVYLFEETGHKAGYALAAFSIAQDIYNAYGSKDNRRLKAIYTTAKNVIFEFLLKKAGLSLNPFISIGIDVIDWGLNTFIKQTFSRHKRDWEMAYIKYMDKHYQDEYWNKLIRNYFSEHGGTSRAKSEIQKTLNRFWENPDTNFQDMMNKRSTFSSTRGGALAETYKKGIIADYYLWEVKPKIIGKLREEIMYARNEARYKAINSVKKLLDKFDKDELKSIQKAIEMAKNFKKAVIIVKPEKITLKPGESKKFSATLKIGEKSIPLSGNDLKWSHSGGKFKADKSMEGKSIKISASISGKKGTAIIYVGDKTDNGAGSDLAVVRGLADQMEELISNSQQMIKDADDLCSSGNSQLDNARQELISEDDKKEGSPLDKYDKFHFSLTEMVDNFEKTRKKSDKEYISAGLNKKECEKMSMEACEGANVLLSIRTSLKKGYGSKADPGKIKRGVDAFAAKAKEYGNKSLSDIKSVEEISKKGEEEYKSIKESVDSYLKEIRQAKKDQAGSSGNSSGIFSSISKVLSGGKNRKDGSSSNYIKESEKKLSALQAKIEKLESIESKLSIKYTKGEKLLYKNSDNGNAQVMLREIKKLYTDFKNTIKNLKECRDKLSVGINKTKKDSPDKDQINYDSRENRDKIGRLHILVKKAHGYVTGIRENFKWAKSLKLPVEKAIKSAKQCSEKAEKFLDEINNIVNEKDDSGFSDAGDVTGQGGDSDKCDSIFREFDKFIRNNNTVYNENDRKKALAILNKGKDCPNYENWLSVLSMQGYKDDSGFSDAGSVTGETSRTPPVSSETKNKDDPMLGNWVAEVELKNMKKILSGKRKPPILNISIKNGTYFGVIKSLYNPDWGSFNNITQFGSFNSRLKIGQVIIKLNRISGNTFTGQCVVATYNVPPPKYVWTKCTARIIKKGELKITIPAIYDRWNDGVVRIAASFDGKKIVNTTIYRLPGTAKRTGRR